MPLVNTKEMFLDAYKNKYSVGAFNVDSIFCDRHYNAN